MTEERKTARWKKWREKVTSEEETWKMA
jgi:hypothetical protein